MTTPPAGVRVPSASSDVTSEGWVVTCDLAFDVVEPAEIALALAAADGHRVISERLDSRSDGGRLTGPTELAGPHGGRLHLLRAPAGLLSVSYRAELAGSGPAPVPGSASVSGSVSVSGWAPVAGAAPTSGPGPTDPGLPDLDQLIYLRPSRYCPSDHIVGFAVAEFGHLAPGRPRVEAITDWIHDRVGYVAGSSAVHDTAEDTLLTGQGVCRDFAHLGITLCRALQIPARFVGVYAPGLTPMDFHAVFEAWVDDAWWLYDATRKVPRPSLVRIATGRDAADAAFASVLRGIASLRTIEITATVSGVLPEDEHRESVRIT
ncbi:MAG: transglutaminase-like domain-containing protein [Frankia sp.]